MTSRQMWWDQDWDLYHILILFSSILHLFSVCWRIRTCIVKKISLKKLCHLKNKHKQVKITFGTADTQIIYSTNFLCNKHLRISRFIFCVWVLVMWVKLLDHENILDSKSSFNIDYATKTYIFFQRKATYNVIGLSFMHLWTVFTISFVTALSLYLKL